MLEKEIDRPLGQSRPSSRQPGPAPSRKALFTVVAGFLVLGISGVIALREKPFRQPVVEVVAAKPEPAKPVQEAAKPPTPAVETPSIEVAGSKPEEDGPSIVRMGTSGETTSGVVVIRDPSEMTQNPRTAHVPDKALLERSDNGPLPVVAADGRRPFDVYARKWSGARGAKVAIVIGGLGMSQTGTQDAIRKLQPEVTLGFAPQGNSIGRWMTEARRSGHEIVMQVPLEPFDYPNIDPGRNTLTVAAAADENIGNLKWTLSRTTNYTGVMNYMGARFTTDQNAMAPFMAELGKRGLLYLDDGTSARSVASELALKNGVPFASGDAVIDDVRERGAILAKLDQLERTARAKGSAVGTGSAFDLTVDTVRAWVGEARKRGIEIVPVSAVALDPRRG